MIFDNLVAKFHSRFIVDVTDNQKMPTFLLIKFACRCEDWRSQKYLALFCS